MQAYKDIQIGHKMKYIIFSLKKDGVDAANKTVWKWNIDKVRGHSNGPAAAAPAAAAPAPTATATAGGARMGGAAPMVTAASPAAITPAASPGPAAGPAPAAGAGHPRRTSGAGQDAQGNEAAWAELMSTLPRDDGVFVLFDWGGKASDGRIIDKLLLLKWCVPRCLLLAACLLLLQLLLCAPHNFAD